MYREENLVSIAKRENNKKRNYVVVNKLQGKHIPVSPTLALKMFSDLAYILQREYSEEKLLLIGFAETATAIGASIAVLIDAYYMQTTREDIKNVEYLFFSEAHSHATEQKLIKNDLDKIIGIVDRIIFIEDEVTTGNTILNIINIIKEKYNKKVLFSVASLLNGMNSHSEEEYLNRNIKMHYLLKTNNSTYTEKANSYTENGDYHSIEVLEKLSIKINMYEFNNYIDTRRLTEGANYLKACEKLWNNVSNSLGEINKNNILVIGTEEFMYPALYIGKKLEEKGNAVKCHSTTRSPISVNISENYPLHSRFELVSMYDGKRKTFIYDLSKYDKVIIVTDSKCNFWGKNSLINAIASCGNNDITIVRWC